MTYLEEGEFKNDLLDSTFGRKIQLNGHIRIGWFIEDKEIILHGYGKDSKTQE